MIMTTFAESYDFTGKSVHPVTTHAMSGLGTTERDYARSCPGAVIGEGIAVRGETVRDAGPAVEAWLRRARLLRTVQARQGSLPSAHPNPLRASPESTPS
jgi:hypothetical protein